MGFLFISLFLLMLLRFSTTTSSSTVEKTRRFDRFKGGSSSSELKSSEFQLQGNKADKNIGDQVFGADKRKVHTGPNPLHNR
ncbi:hypothetical protein Lal_00030426 [Lupinus albus]|nr:hypothetical protein Lal_00030426 [Lupinus albus]